MFTVGVSLCQTLPRAGSRFVLDDDEDLDDEDELGHAETYADYMPAKCEPRYMPCLFICLFVRLSVCPFVCLLSATCRVQTHLSTTWPSKCEPCYMPFPFVFLILTGDAQSAIAVLVVRTVCPGVCPRHFSSLQRCCDRPYLSPLIAT